MACRPCRQLTSLVKHKSRLHDKPYPAVTVITSEWVWRYSSLFKEDVLESVRAAFSVNSPSISKGYARCCTFSTSFPIHYPFAHMYYSARSTHSLVSPGANLLVEAFLLHLPFKSCRLKLNIFALTAFLDSMGSMRVAPFCFDEQWNFSHRNTGNIGDEFSYQTCVYIKLRKLLKTELGCCVKHK